MRGAFTRIQDLDMATVDLCTSSTRPSTPSTGQVALETDTKKLIIYDGSNWQTYASSGTLYELDASNTLSARPVVHFDAAWINGKDGTGNPASGTFSGTWVDRNKGMKIEAYSSTVDQATYYTSGENGVPYFYLSADGGFNGPKLYFETPFLLQEDFVVIMVGKRTNTAGKRLVALTCFSRDFERSDLSAVIASNSNIQYFGEGGEYPLYTEATAKMGAFRNQSTTLGYGGTETLAKDDATAVRCLMWRRKDFGSGARRVRGYVDGDNETLDITTDSEGTFKAAGIGLPQDADLDMDIYEIIVFDQDLSTADLNSWNAYVDNKYNTGSGGMEAQTGF